MECEETGLFKHELAFSNGLTVCNAQKATSMARKWASEWLRNATRANQVFSLSECDWLVHAAGSEPPKPSLKISKILVNCVQCIPKQNVAKNFPKKKISQE